MHTAGSRIENAIVSATNTVLAMATTMKYERMYEIMNQCICNFSSKADDNEMLHNHMCNNHASLEIPYHTILRILDTTREEEYLFTVNYCPVCGRSVKF